MQEQVQTRTDYFKNPENIRKAVAIAGQIGAVTNFDWFTIDKFYSTNGKKAIKLFNESKEDFINRIDILCEFGFCAGWGEKIGSSFKKRFKIILSLEQKKAYIEFQLRELEKETIEKYNSLTIELERVKKAIEDEQKETISQSGTSTKEEGGTESNS
jgi:hypothetical protein